MFVDQIKIQAKAGDGGRGCVSFRREKFVPMGGPDGGDGGKGGDVILLADPQVDTLANYFYEPIQKAPGGVHGKGKQMTGRSGKDLVLRVPVGTLVYRMPEQTAAPEETDEDAEPEKPRRRRKIDTAQLELLADLATDHEELVLCKGGEGGLGNVHFKSSRNQAPVQFREGGEGEAGVFYLELRKIADVGLVGYPNAGKSTLLGQLSAAHPKVAAYPFTTLHPMVGVVEFPDWGRITVADIPGLIEGAHRDVGLGHDFLRHIVRCKVLLFVIDIAGSEARHPVDDLSTLREELKLYDPTLADRPWLVAANKIDLPEAAELLAQFRQRFERLTILPISASEGRGIEELKAELRERVEVEARPA